jgi:transposase InsO family protein
MKYGFMEEHREIFRLKKMCMVLKVSRSGYYAWRKRMPSKRQVANKWLLERIQEVYRKSRRVYGSPRITDGLNDQGIICGKNRVARIMKYNNICAKVWRKFRRTTDSRHSYPASVNLLLDGNERVQIWASDITFIPTREGWMYVATVMDVSSRKIIGLSIKDRLTQELTTDALKQAISRQRPCKGLIHHSDRGKQYASYEYRDLLNRYGIRSSMSRSGNCYDNAHIESFWSTLKRELVHGERYQTRDDARLSIFEYIEVFYNRIRKHSALGYKSPEQYGKLVCAT